MKWIWLLLVLVVPANAQVWAPAVWTPGKALPRRIQGCGTLLLSGASTVSCSFSTTLTNGDAVVIGAACFSAGATATVGGVSATLVDDDHASSGLVTFYLLNVSGSPTNVTLSCSSSGGYMVTAEDIRNIATSAALDGHAINFQNTNSGGTDAVTSGSITTTGDGDFIFGFTNSNPNGGDTITPGSGYIGWQAGAASGVAIGPYDGSTYQYTWEDESQVQTFHGSVAATFTPQFTFYHYTTAIMALKSL